jgi:hypothetical protein
MRSDGQDERGFPFVATFGIRGVLRTLELSSLPIPGRRFGQDYQRTRSSTSYFRHPYYSLETLAALGASGIVGGTENNQTWSDPALCKAVRPHDGAVGGGVRSSCFRDVVRSLSGLLLSRAKRPQGLQRQLSILISRDWISPTSVRRYTKIEKFPPEKVCDGWCI